MGHMEAARNAQSRLGHLGLSIDEIAMPREECASSQELEVTQVGSRPLRNRQASWKQTLAEAAP